MSNTVVLTYGQLFELSELYRGQSPVARNPAGQGIYSSGRLEKALKAHRPVHVVCTVSELSPHDRWWADQIPKHHVHLRLDRLRIVDLQLENDSRAQELYPWKSVFTSLGLTWSVGFTNVNDVKRVLHGSHVTLGEAIAPWSFRQHP